MKLLLPALILALVVPIHAAENGFTVTVEATGKDGISAKTVMPNLALMWDTRVTIPLRSEAISTTLLFDLFFELDEQTVQFDIVDGERSFSVGEKTLPVKYAEGMAHFAFGKKTTLVEMNGGAVTITVTPPEGREPGERAPLSDEIPAEVRDALEFEAWVDGQTIRVTFYNPTEYLIDSIIVKVLAEKTDDFAGIDRLYESKTSVEPNTDTSISIRAHALSELPQGSEYRVILEKAYGSPR